MHAWMHRYAGEDIFEVVQLHPSHLLVLKTYRSFYRSSTFLQEHWLPWVLYCVHRILELVGFCKATITHFASHVYPNGWNTRIIWQHLPQRNIFSSCMRAWVIWVSWKWSKDKLLTGDSHTVKEHIGPGHFLRHQAFPHLHFFFFRRLKYLQ